MSMDVIVIGKAIERLTTKVDKLTNAVVNLFSVFIVMILFVVGVLIAGAW